MKSTLFGIALAALSSVAMAADLPARTSPPAPAPFPIVAAQNWAGFYVGFNTSYLRFRDTIKDGWTNPADAFGAYNPEWITKANNPAYTLGMHAGYRWYLGKSKWLLGLEAETNKLFVKKRYDCIYSLTNSTCDSGVLGNSRAAWDIIFGPTLSYDMVNILPFVQIGIHAIKDNGCNFLKPIFAGQNSLPALTCLNPRNIPASLWGRTVDTTRNTLRIGPMISTGFNYALTNKFSLKAAIRYSYFPKKRYVLVGFGPDYNDSTASIFSGTIGLSYRFSGSAASVVAKY